MPPPHRHARRVEKARIDQRCIGPRGGADEACAAYILSQKAEGWKALSASYDDGGFSGGNTERPALQRLLADIAAKRIRIVVVYKVDRLTRSLADFAKLVESFDTHGVSFVSVTQQFNTTSSMGRLTLNVLLSFAQFEREVTGERIRDKIAASKRKGLWMGGHVPIGYLPDERTLKIDEPQAERIRSIFQLYLDLGCVRRLKTELARREWVTPPRQSRRENMTGGRPFSRGHLYRILGNPIYIGQIAHLGAIYEGQHPAIIDRDLWATVQERLRLNRQGHLTQSKVNDPGLLTGLMFEESGQRLAPAYTKKGARRYRYYTAQAIPDLHPEPAKARRWPAQPLEDAVVAALIRFLTDESRLVDVMGTIDASQARRRLSEAKQVANQLAETSTAAKLDLLRRLVARITLHAGRLEIAVHVRAIWPDRASTGESTTIIEVPVELKRCGTAGHLIVRASNGAMVSAPDTKLVSLLGKAHDWFGRLSDGRCDSVPAIAEAEKLDRSYVRRVIYLAFLAPDIVQRILRGDHPPELTMTRLVRMTPLPMSWTEQRRLLGISN